MDDLKELKDTVRALDQELENLSVLEYDEQILIKASRNAKAREYNRKKKFYHRRIERIF